MNGITIKDVAVKAGVSISTVSRVINNPDAVTLQKRIHVQNIIREMGYTPNAAAREMVIGTSHMVGVLVQDIRNNYISSMLASFNQQMEHRKYGTFICITDTDKKKEEFYIDLMLQKRVEAVVMFGVRAIDSRHDHQLAERLEGIPLIKVGPGFEDCYYNICTDEEEGAFLATEHLIQRGHKQIAFINGPLKYDTYYCKQMGFQKAMSKYNLVISPDHLFNIEYEGFSIDQSYKPTLDMLKLKHRPTAIMVPGDQLALGVYRAVAEMGLRIPEDLAVVGYGNSQISAMLFPPLTTVDQMPTEMGAKVAEMLIDILNGEPRDRQYVYSVQLICRAST